MSTLSPSHDSPKMSHGSPSHLPSPSSSHNSSSIIKEYICKFLPIRPTAQEALIKSQNTTSNVVSYELSNQVIDLYQGYSNNHYGGYFLFDWEITLLIREAIRQGHTRCYIFSYFGIELHQWQRLRKLGYLI